MAPPMHLESDYHLDPCSVRARLVDDENQSYAKDAPYIPIDRQVYTFHSQRGEKVVINEVYQLSPSSPIIVKECGSWDRQAGLKLTSASILQRRQDFQGHLFRAETVFNPIFAIKKENNKIGGVLGEIWHDVLEKMLNFTTVVKPSKDNQYGALGKDKQWTGVIGALLEDETDIGLANLYKTESRGKAVFFSPGLQSIATRFFIKFPGKETNWLTFLEPLSPSLWIAILLFLLTISTMLTVADRLGQEKKLSPGSFTPTNSLLVIWGSWLAQGSWLEPKAIPTKMVFLFSFLFGITIYTAYSAKLISFLSVPKLVLPFTSLDELLKAKEFSVGVLRGGALHTSFVNALPGSIRFKIADQLISEEDLVDSVQQAVHRLRRDSKYTLITSSYDNPVLDTCDFLEMPFDFDVFTVAIAWNPRLPHRHILNFALSKMIESGQVDRIKRKWLGKTKMDCLGTDTFKSMDIKNTVSAFVLVFAAASISLLFLLVEVE